MENKTKLGDLGSAFLATALATSDIDSLYSNLNKFKEENQMETKSRYEVIANLESQKRQLVLERDGLSNQLLDKQRSLKELKRDIEDQEEDIANFKKSMEERKETIKELISSVDLSLQRLTQSQDKKS